MHFFGVLPLLGCCSYLGGYPYFGHFLTILGIFDEKVVPDWSPRGCKPVEKTVHHRSWAISEALPRVYFALPACLGPNTPSGGDDPRRVVYRFLCWLASSGRPVWHNVFTGNPQNRQKVPKMGVTQIRATLLLLFSINLA